MASASLRIALLASATLHLGAAVAIHGPTYEVPVQSMLTATLRAAPPVSAPGTAMPAPRKQQRAAPPSKVRQVAGGLARLAAAPAAPAAPDAVAPPAPVATAETRLAPVPAASPASAPAPAPALELPRFDAAYLANPPPAYPASARRRGVEGTVVVEARISPGGEPREIKLAASANDDTLDTAALQAVRGWRFEPARRGSQAVEAWVRIPLVFRLN